MPRTPFRPSDAVVLPDPPQAADDGRQLQGLKALQGIARNAAMFLPLQAAFREAGGFPLLVSSLCTHCRFVLPRART
jgi:hypothetical protein